MSKENKITGKAVDLAILKRIVSYAKAYKFNFTLAACTTVVFAFISPIRPILVQYTFDEYVAKHNPGMLLNMTIVLVLLLILEAFMQFADSFLTNRLGQNIIKD